MSIMFKKRILLVVFCSIFMLRQVFASSAGSELDVKAAFVIKFADFIEWPGLTSSSNYFTIGYIGNGELFDALKSLPAATRPRGKELRILTVQKAYEVKNIKPEILVIDSQDGEYVQAILKQIGDLPIVSITHGDGFAEMGSLINFYIESSRLRFEVNLYAAERVNIKVSSQLLRLGRVISK